MLRRRVEATDPTATLLRASIWGAGRVGELTHLAFRGVRQVQGALATASATVTATATAMNRARTWVMGREQEPRLPTDHSWVMVDSPQSSVASTGSERDDEREDDNGGLFDETGEGLAEGYALVGGDNDADNEDDSNGEDEDRDNDIDEPPAYQSTPETHEDAPDSAQHHEPPSTFPGPPSLFSPHQPPIPRAPRRVHTVHEVPQLRAGTSILPGGMMRTDRARSLTSSGMRVGESQSHDTGPQANAGVGSFSVSEERGGGDGFQSVPVYGDSGPTTRQARLERARRYGRGPLGGGYD